MKNIKERLRDIKNRMKMTNTLSGVPECGSGENGAVVMSEAIMT